MGKPKYTLEKDCRVLAQADTADEMLGCVIASDLDNSWRVYEWRYDGHQPVEVDSWAFSESEPVLAGIVQDEIEAPKEIDSLRTHQILESQKKRMDTMIGIVKYATRQFELIATDNLVLPEVVALESIKEIRRRIDGLLVALEESE